MWRKFRPWYSWIDCYFYLFVYSIASVTVPILLLHAEDDFTVPHELGELVSTRAFHILLIPYFMQVSVLSSTIQPLCIKLWANKIVYVKFLSQFHIVYICPENKSKIFKSERFWNLRDVFSDFTQTLTAHINYESIEFQRTNSTAWCREALLFLKHKT